MADTEGSVRRGVSRILANKTEIGIGLLLLVLAFVSAFAIGEFVPGVSIRVAIPALALAVGIIGLVWKWLSETEHPRTGGDEGDGTSRPELEEVYQRPAEIPDPTDDPLGTVESQGFERLTDDEFKHGTVDRETCWRREFTFTEVAAGIPIDRQRAREGHPSVTDELLDDLADGGAVRLTGQPGSGKTTATRMVAHRWHEQEGAVLYRQQQSDPITRPGKLERAIRQFTDDGPVLVIIEDVARHGTVRFLETLHGLETVPEVSVLINAREREWENLGDLAAQHDAFNTSSKRGRDVLETRFRYPDQRNMPPLHTNEIERLKDRVEEETGHKVPANAEQLESAIETDHGVSPMLLLSYHFPVHGVTAKTEGHETALHANVAETYRRINGPDFDDQIREGVDDVETLRQVALLVNVMNAAELPLDPVFFNSVGDPEDDIETVEAAVDALDALLFFGEEEGRKMSHHPVWSELYLDCLLEEGETEARERVETVVNALFEFTVEKDSRVESGEGHLDPFVELIFSIGPAYPQLAPLFSTSEESGIDVPDACSAATKANCALYRHQMYQTLGDLEKSREELRQAEKRVKRGRYNVVSRVLSRLLGPFTSKKSRHAAVLLNERGNQAIVGGDYEQAHKHVQQSLDIYRKLNDLDGEATSLNNLGVVARNRGDFEQAREYHQQSLDSFRELGNRAGEATSLNNLGYVTMIQEDYEQACEYHQRSLDTFRELGDRGSEARCLEGLGLVARHKGDYEQAREYHQRSLAIFREVSDRAGEASSLNNLGQVAQSKGNYEQAREYHRCSLEIYRELGDRDSEIHTLVHLGEVALAQDEYEDAREFYEQVVEFATESGAVRHLLHSLDNLSRAHENLGDHDEAMKTCEKALSVIDESDTSGIEMERPRFLQRKLHIDDSADVTRTSYRRGLRAILRDEEIDTMKWWEAAWDSRENVEPDEDRYSIGLAAGVGLAALTASLDLDGITAYRHEKLTTIEPHRDRLSEPARVLYEYLLANDPSMTPDDLRDSLDVDTEDVDPADLDLDALETLAHAQLLESLDLREVAIKSPDIE